jgi:hypothetical protein
MARTLEEIRTLGLEALRERLGQAGMIRFMQQFETGSGNYATTRHEWVDRMSMKELKSRAKTKGRKKSASHGGRDK